MDGIIIIDKPTGWTSHDVVAKLRGVIRRHNETTVKQKVGHGGTLDPMATGVLPIFIGKATKAAMYCENAEKEYIAGLRFGIVTDTQDITGNILSTNNAIPRHCRLGSEGDVLTTQSPGHITGHASVSVDDLNIILPQFLGKQKQVPPMYSAVKKDGKKLYELARQGIEIERPARDIEIYSIEIVEAPSAGDAPLRVPPDIYLRIACSKGTYVRTLCHDIGQALGCGAALSYLRRTRAGVFTIENAHPLDEIIENFSPDLLLPVDGILPQSP